MNLKQLALEFVELVRIDHTGREYRECMPRWLAEIAIGSIPAAQPEVAYAWIEPMQIDRWAPYAARPVPLQQIWQAAFTLAEYLPARLVD